MRALLVLTPVLLLGCQPGEPQPIPFQPASASADLLLGGIYVYATEQSPTAIGYTHPPRSVYLTMRNPTEAQLTAGIPLDDVDVASLAAGHAAMRIVEHAQEPRLYVVEHGTVRATFAQPAGTWGAYTIHVDAVLVDPLDGARISVDTTFAAPVAAIS